MSSNVTVEKFDDGHHGIGLLFLTVAFFHVVSYVCSFLPVPETVLKRHDDFRTFRWRNLIISLCHAFIVGLWSLYCIVFYFSEMWKDMVFYSNGPTYTLCCFTAGYFIYDIIDIVRNGRVREKWDIIIHHSAIIFSAHYVIAYVECVGYQVLGMVAEVNTTFLHARQLLHFAEVPRSHWFVRLNAYANFLTFVTFRFIPMGILFWGVTFDGHRVPLWYVSYYTMCLVILTVMNFVLLFRLIRSDCRSGGGGGGPMRATSDIHSMVLRIVVKYKNVD